MRFLIIIPAHNEADHLFFCLESLRRQTHQDYEIIVVNDGSTDDTQKIAENFAEKHPAFRVINLDVSAHEPGAKVVKTFYKGLELADFELFDVVCKFDADIIFPPNYLAVLAKVYEENPKAGMVSGLVKIKKSVIENSLAFDFADEKKQWQFENLSSKNHIRGPVKSYRKDCFKQMNGLRPVLGWDNIDVMLARKYGWETIKVKDLWVKHLRPTAYKYKNQKAEKLGEYFYNIGLNFPLAMISSLKSSAKNKSPYEFFITMKSFLKQDKKRILSADEISYIRKLRWQEMLSKFR